MSLPGSGSAPPEGGTGLRSEPRLGTATSTWESEPAGGTAAPDPRREVAGTLPPGRNPPPGAPVPKRPCVLPDAALYRSNPDSGCWGPNTVRTTAQAAAAART